MLLKIKLFRTLAFTKCFPKVIFCGLNSFLKYAWQGFFYSCFVDEFTNLREVVWLRVIHWYLQGIGSRTPCKYQNPWIPRAFTGNGIVFGKNLHTSSCVQVTLENGMGLNSAGLLRFFFAKYYLLTTQSLAGWIHRCRIAYREGWHKVICRFFSF